MTPFGESTMSKSNKFIEERDRAEDTYGHFHAHFPRSNDPILLILRGHLLVEQQLTLLLETFLKKKEALDRARLSFAQKHAIVCALIGAEEKYTPWSAISELNQVRNQLAHRLTIPDAEQKIDKWLQAFFDEAVEGPKTRVERAALVRRAFSFMCGELVGYRRAFQPVACDEKEPTSGQRPTAVKCPPSNHSPRPAVAPP
jgi:hypothetical protein